MKKLFLVFVLFFCVTGAPHFSYAQTPFGGLDFFIFPTTCTIPPDPPELALPTKPCLAYPVPTPNLPPLFEFHIFGMFQTAGVTTGTGILATAIGGMLTNPTPHPLIPPAWVLGYFTPSTPIGGIFIPGFTIYQPYGPPICIESWCIPITTAIGAIDPNSGSASFGGF